MKKYLSRILSFSAALLTLIFMSSCTVNTVETTPAETILPESDPSFLLEEISAPDEELAPGVYINGELYKDDAKFVYYYYTDNCVAKNYFGLGVKISSTESLILGMSLGPNFDISADADTPITDFPLQDDVKIGDISQIALLSFLYYDTADSSNNKELLSLYDNSFFSNAHLKINSFEEEKYADFSLSADITVDDRTFSISGRGYADVTVYTETEESASQQDEYGVYLNGELQTDINAMYSYIPESGNWFGYTLKLNDAEAIFISVMLIDPTLVDSPVIEDFPLSSDIKDEDTKKSAILTVMYNNSDGDSQTLTSLYDDSFFSNARFVLNSFEEEKYADFSLSADIVINGETYSVSGRVSAEHTEM